MKERIAVLLIVIVSIVILIFTDFGKEGRVYDCRLAEISPDFPISVKEECRKLFQEYNNQNNLKNYI